MELLLKTIFRKQLKKRYTALTVLLFVSGVYRMCLVKPATLSGI